MVYFVCETCNETLKKAQVERHVYSCRNCWGVTCVDCNHTFEGESFREHTSCLSEDQKYQGALFKAPKTKVKNRGVNEIWTDAVMRAAEAAAKGTAPKAISGHLVRMGDLGNVPRQEKKFKNFAKNSLRVFDDGAVAKLWEYLDGVKNDITKEEQASSDAVAAAATTKTPAKQSAEGSEKKGKKRGRDTEAPAAEDSTTVSTTSTTSPTDDVSTVAKKGKVKEAENGEQDVDAASRKALGKAAIAILKKAPNTELAVKRLVKQTVAATREKGGAAADMDEKTLKRALRQRLKEGTLKNVTVTNDVAIYCR